MFGAAFLSSGALAEQGVDLHNPKYHFYFHRTDSTSDTALADLTQCAELAKPVISINDILSNNMGLLGNFMASTDRRVMRAAVMRRCMHLHGYARYAMPKSKWSEIVGDGDMAIDKSGEINSLALKIFAELAAGPVPQDQRMDP